MYIYVNRAWQALGVNTSFNLGGEPVVCSYVAYTLHTLSTIMTFGLKHSGQSVWPEIHFEKKATVLRKPVR